MTGKKRYLYEFAPISLNQMESVQLMNRKEVKYVFAVNRLTEILALAGKHYRILEIGRERSFAYNTTYLDTCDRLFFCQQATGRYNRHKVRYRTYESTGTTFLEIKRKTNKDRTVKWRIRKTLEMNGCDNEAILFLQQYLPVDNTNLIPVLTNRFTRITLAGLETHERITIDHSLSFSGTNNQLVMLPYLAIAELKHEGNLRQSTFARIMKQCRIRSSGFSKYCMGSVMLYDMPRKGAFKQKLLLLNRIKNENNNNALKSNENAWIGFN